MTKYNTPINMARILYSNRQWTQLIGGALGRQPAINRFPKRQSVNKCILRVAYTTFYHKLSTT